MIFSMANSLKVNPFPKLRYLLRLITKHRHMPHFAVVLSFRLAVEVEVGRGVGVDKVLGFLDVLTEDIEHDGWGVEVDSRKRLS